MFIYWLSQPRQRVCLSVFTFILVTVAGLYAISWQTTQGLHRDSEATLTQAIKLVDITLSNASAVAVAVKNTAGSPCNEQTVQELRLQTAGAPDVRSVNLYQGNTIYCTSLFGAITEQMSPKEYAGGRLLLMSGNIVTPDHTLIIYRLDVHGDGVLVGIDGYFLHHILNSLGDSLSLRIGEKWMDSRGLIHPYEIYDKNESMGAYSTHYPYEVRKEISRSDHWSYVLDYASVSLVLFPLAGIFIAVLTYVLTGRFGTPISVLKTALKKKQFVPYLQPVVDGTSLQLTGCEVLMRWQQSPTEIAPPQQFIPLAEESGLIVPITRQMMADVRERCAPVAMALPKNFHFGFNICARHFDDLTLVGDCKAFINAFRDNPIVLVLELTERELIESNERTHSIFKALRRLGVMIALDDFGTGHSSLTYLQTFHIDILKIDQSFISRIGTDALSSHIVDNVIDLAKRLQMVIVAEGIETQLQIDYLVPYKLEFLQGYFFSKPLPLEQFTNDWLKK